MNRRQVLRNLGSLPLAVSVAAPILDLAGCRETAHSVKTPAGEGEQAKVRPLQPSKAVAVEVDNFDARARLLLEEIRVRAAYYFLERTNARTGLICDRAPASGTGEITGRYAVASIAATGFGLSALSVAAQHSFFLRTLSRRGY